MALGVGAYVAWPDSRRAGDAVAVVRMWSDRSRAWVRRAQAAQVAVWSKRPAVRFRAWSLGPRNLDVPKSLLHCVGFQLWR